MKNIPWVCSALILGQLLGKQGLMVFDSLVGSLGFSLRIHRATLNRIQRTSCSNGNDLSRRLRKPSIWGGTWRESQVWVDMLVQYEKFCQQSAHSEQEGKNSASVMIALKCAILRESRNLIKHILGAKPSVLFDRHTEQNKLIQEIIMDVDHHLDQRCPNCGPWIRKGPWWYTRGGSINFFVNIQIIVTNVNVNIFSFEQVWSSFYILSTKKK